jgi:3-dehydroquinate synthase
LLRLSYGFAAIQVYNLAMEKQNVILTGFMGTGKTTVGQLLAAKLGCEFVDTDALIEAQDGRAVATIFAEDGEDAFRHMEAEVARTLAGRRGLVIATGGRMMLDEKNAALLAAAGPVFCLTADPQVILDRLKDDEGQRPLLIAPDPARRVSELLAERSAAYGRFPQIGTNGKSAAEVAAEVALLVEHKVLPVAYPHGRYNVLVGARLLANLTRLADLRGPIVLITDSNVGPLYAAECGAVTAVMTMPAGEQHKTLDTVRTLYDELLAAGIDRQATIVALGGGVVGDVAGFVAATYMRGVDFVQCPTSLLAMVDASVGAKTGVDMPQGKNLIGAFKQPTAVLADISTLRTLPAAEFASGMAEVIKSGIIGDAALFIELEQAPALTAPQDEEAWGALAEIVTRAIKVKRDVVEEDPFEKGRRAVLNLGHTFGHAIEQVSGYEVRHGEGVAMGMMAAAHLAAALGYAGETLQQRIGEVLVKAGLPRRIPADLQAEALYAAMGSDKKKANGRLRFILPRDIGDVIIVDDVTAEAVLTTLRACGAG